MSFSLCGLLFSDKASSDACKNFIAGIGDDIKDGTLQKDYNAIVTQIPQIPEKIKTLTTALTALIIMCAVMLILLVALTFKVYL